MTTQKTLKEVLVRDAMSRRIQSVMVKDTLEDAISLMKDNNFTMLPVVDHHGKCIGIVSRSDMTEVFMNEDQTLTQATDIEAGALAEGLRSSVDTCKNRKVSEVMVYDVILVKDQENLTKASQIMASKKVHHLPVINEQEKLVGIVSTFDIVKAVAQAQ